MNLSTLGASSMLELAEPVLRLVGSKSKVLFLPLPTDGPGQRKPEITLAVEQLYWFPTMALQDGHKETI